MTIEEINKLKPEIKRSPNMPKDKFVEPKLGSKPADNLFDDTVEKWEGIDKETANFAENWNKSLESIGKGINSNKDGTILSTGFWTDGDWKKFGDDQGKFWKKELENAHDRATAAWWLNDNLDSYKNIIAGWWAESEKEAKYEMTPWLWMYPTGIGTRVKRLALFANDFTKSDSKIKDVYDGTWSTIGSAFNKQNSMVGIKSFKSMTGFNAGGKAFLEKVLFPKNNLAVAIGTKLSEYDKATNDRLTSGDDLDQASSTLSEVYTFKRNEFKKKLDKSYELVVGIKTTDGITFALEIGEKGAPSPKKTVNTQKLNRDEKLSGFPDKALNKLKGNKPGVYSSDGTYFKNRIRLYEGGAEDAIVKPEEGKLDTLQIGKGASTARQLNSFKFDKAKDDGANGLNAKNGEQVYESVDRIDKLRKENGFSPDYEGPTKAAAIEKSPVDDPLDISENVPEKLSKVLPKIPGQAITLLKNSLFSNNYNTMIFIYPREEIKTSKASIAEIIKTANESKGYLETSDVMSKLLLSSAQFSGAEITSAQNILEKTFMFRSEGITIPEVKAQSFSVNSHGVTFENVFYGLPTYSNEGTIKFTLDRELALLNSMFALSGAGSDVDDKTNVLLLNLMRSSRFYTKYRVCIASGFFGLSAMHKEAYSHIKAGNAKMEVIEDILSTDFTKNKLSAALAQSEKNAHNNYSTVFLFDDVKFTGSNDSLVLTSKGSDAASLGFTYTFREMYALKASYI